MTPARAPGGSGTPAFTPRSVVFVCPPGAGVPTACFAIARAAMMYWSRNEGDTFNALAMLSNPSLMSSLGSSVDDVHVEAEQVAHRVRVLGAIQPVNPHAAGIRVGGARLVERRLQVAGEGLHVGGRGPRCPWRRHHPAAQLADRALPRERVFLGMGEVEPVELELRRLQPLVVAGDAVAIDDGARLRLRLRADRAKGKEQRAKRSGRRLIRQSHRAPARAPTALDTPHRGTSRHPLASRP